MEIKYNEKKTILHEKKYKISEEEQTISTQRKTCKCCGQKNLHESFRCHDCCGNLYCSECQKYFKCKICNVVYCPNC